GAPSLEIERVPVAPGVVRRIHTTIEAQPSRYEEEHFQWEEPRWAGVRRFFDEGPLTKLVVVFVLHALAEGSRVEFIFGVTARSAETVPVARAVADQVLPEQIKRLGPELLEMSS